LNKQTFYYEFIPRRVYQNTSNHIWSPVSKLLHCPLRNEFQPLKALYFSLCHTIQTSFVTQLANHIRTGIQSLVIMRLERETEKITFLVPSLGLPGNFFSRYATVSLKIIGNSDGVKKNQGRAISHAVIPRFLTPEARFRSQG
jgi:hypothetical protein